jgi:toluene monooxygenase electron transfer component
VRIAVTARNGAREFDCDPEEKILHAGLRCGVGLPYECATGTCGTCKARLVAGGVRSAWSDAPGRRYLKSDTEFLMCQGLPTGDCALELNVALREPAVHAPRATTGILRAPRALTHDVLAFEVALDTPMDFEAGQFALLTAPGTSGARAYSMVNFEPAAQALSFVVKKKPGGALSEWLFRPGIDGTSVDVFGPLGQAIFRPDLNKHVLCVAGGSGIAGMMSILAHACDAGHFTAWDGHVFFGVRTPRDVFFLDELEALRARRAGRLAITVALSDEDIGRSLPDAYPHFTFARGLVHAVAAERMAGRFADLRAYVAGPPPMVDACLRWLLREARLPPADIRYDKFS